MTKISEAEFARICDGIYDDRESIIKHNPLGSREGILLWMLMSCLISYLNLNDDEIQSFKGKPGAEAYRDAITFVLRKRRLSDFDAKKYMDQMTSL